MENLTGKGLAGYAISKIGLSYWYGTQGQTATQALLDARSRAYPSHYTAERMQTYKKQIGRQVFDCAGLIEAYINECKGNTQYDTTANNMYASCKEKGFISTMPDIIGVLVFYDGHVGVYVGNGLVVEARGFNYGVCETKVKDRPWTKWGKHPLLTYNDAVKAVATPQLFTMPTIRKGDKGDSVKVLQKLLILTGAEIIVDGEFGAKIHTAVTLYQTRQKLVPDGIVGAKTWGELLK